MLSSVGLIHEPTSWYSVGVGEREIVGDFHKLLRCGVERWNGGTVTRGAVGWVLFKD